LQAKDSNIHEITEPEQFLLYEVLPVWAVYSCGDDLELFVVAAVSVLVLVILKQSIMASKLAITDALPFSGQLLGDVKGFQKYSNPEADRWLLVGERSHKGSGPRIYTLPATCDLRSPLLWLFDFSATSNQRPSLTVFEQLLTIATASTIPLYFNAFRVSNAIVFRQ
jgi:hypothetical protein